MLKKPEVDVVVPSEDQPGNLLSEKISRRTFGKLLGAQTLLASAASAVTLSGCGGGGGDDEPAVVDPGTKVLTRGAFVATVSDYFNWPHSSEYNDRFANPQPNFVDVVLGVTPYAKQIETALEENLISNVQGNFYPDQSITREDAADIYVKAFLVPAAVSNPLTAFTDAGTISANRLASVKAMVAAGFMSGTSATTFAPKGTLTASDAKAILTKITSTVVAPVQVMPKPGTTSPRRYVSYMVPTAGATIYITETEDGSEPEDPTTSTKAITYDVWKNGVRQYKFPDVAPTAQKLVRVKAVAKKNGMATSTVREFIWNIYRPLDAPFEAKLVHAATATTPAVWMIYNMSESVQANSFFIEGSKGGIVFDFLQYAYKGTVGSNEGMKPFVDSLSKTKNYVAILGHNHVDHVAQIASFSDNGIKVYTSIQDKTQLIASTASPMYTAASIASFIRAGNAAIALTDGQVFDLGNCKVQALQAPGHENGLVTITIDTAGWVYSTDMWACNRPYTADTTGYSGVKADLMLSLTQQLLANHQKFSTTGEIYEVTNAHQQLPVGMTAVNNFVQTFQDEIDLGPAGTRPSIRSAEASRMGWVTKFGKDDFWAMWRDKNWIANELGGKYSATTLDNLTKPTAAAGYPTNATIDYNGTDGYKKYSVLSNVQITGGTLVGVTVYWAAAATAATGGADNKLANKFDPWTYAYTINVPAANGSITFKPTAMSNKITSMKVNGAAVKQGDSVTVSVSAGSKITVDIVAPDGVTTSSYTFTIAKV
jgi:hypothetical protein